MLDIPFTDGVPFTDGRFDQGIATTAKERRREQKNKYGRKGTEKRRQVLTAIKESLGMRHCASELQVHTVLADRCECYCHPNSDKKLTLYQVLP